MNSIQRTAESGYQRLLVHRKANELALEIYRATGAYPKEETFGITGQMRKAAASVPNKLVEGYGQKSIKDKFRSYSSAQTSLTELEYLIEFSGKLGYLNQESSEQLKGLKREVLNLLNSFIKSLNTDRRSLIAGR